MYKAKKTLCALMSLLLYLVPGGAGAAAASDLLQRAELRNGVWHLSAGVYHGNFVVFRSARLHCDEGAVIDATGEGSGLRIQAPDVEVSGCDIRNWGRDLTAMDAGIFIERQARGARVDRSRLSGPGFGIWVDATPEVTLTHNRISGDIRIRSQDRGNGIHLFAVTGARVKGNEVWHVRDGIYIDTSNGNTLQENFLHDLRYGIHYMYSHSNRVLNNHTRHTRTGYALMQSKRLEVVGNLSEDDQNYGILLNYITDSTLIGNRVKKVSQGSIAGEFIDGAEGKALFVYNSVFNVMRNNRFEHSDIGIHLTAGSEDNQVSGNAFIDNRRQVKYVATRLQEWSERGRGNYWSDYLGWDGNGDGIGDTHYEPNDNIDRLLWQYPQVRLLMHSPAIETLRWVQQAFPVVRSPGVRDSAPLMRAPRLDRPENTLAGEASDHDPS